MEQLNRVELRGTIGCVRTQKVGDSSISRFTLATNFAYKDKAGCPVIETTWHNISAFAGKGIPDDLLSSITKGDKVEVIGRLRNVRIATEDGSERSAAEVLATRIERIPEETVLSFQA